MQEMQCNALWAARNTSLQDKHSDSGPSTNPVDGTMYCEWSAAFPFDRISNLWAGSASALGHPYLPFLSLWFFSPQKNPVQIKLLILLPWIAHGRWRRSYFGWCPLSLSMMFLSPKRTKWKVHVKLDIHWHCSEENMEHTLKRWDIITFDEIFTDNRW